MNEELIFGRSGFLVLPSPDRLDPTRGVKGNPLNSDVIPFSCHPETSFAAPLAATANGKRFGFRLGVNGHIGPAAVQVQEYMLKAS